MRARAILIGDAPPPAISHRSSVVRCYGLVMCWVQGSGSERWTLNRLILEPESNELHHPIWQRGSIIPVRLPDKTMGIIRKNRKTVSTSTQLVQSAKRQRHWRRPKTIPFRGFWNSAVVRSKIINKSTVRQRSSFPLWALCESHVDGILVACLTTTTTITANEPAASLSTERAFHVHSIRNDALSEMRSTNRRLPYRNEMELFLFSFRVWDVVVYFGSFVCCFCCCFPLNFLGKVKVPNVSKFFFLSLSFG